MSTRERAISNKRAGRGFQQKLARRFGGKSVGTIEGQDIEHSIWSIEAKKRKAFIGSTFMAQCVRNCPAGKTPMVVVHVTGSRHNDDLVMLRLKDFEEWFGKINEEGAEEP